jgi:hypothetical protein
MVRLAALRIFGAERGLVSKLDNQGGIRLEVRNQSIRAVVAGSNRLAF